MKYASALPDWAIVPGTGSIPLLKIPGYRITALYDWIEPLHDRALSLIEYRNDVRGFQRLRGFSGL